MSRLTEILKQIPLDELLGETEAAGKDPKTTEPTEGDYTNMRSNITQSKGAYAKRTGALVSAAAIALVAVGGAFAFSKLSKSGPNTDDTDPSASVINTSPSAPSFTPATPETSAANRAILKNYLDSKPELKSGGYTISPGSVDVDSNCSYGLYEFGSGSSRLCKVSGGNVTEYSELSGITGESKYMLPYILYESQLFEMGGSKYAAMLVEMGNEKDYYPAVTILKLDGDKPLCASIGHVGVTMEKYCKGSEYAEFDVNKYPTRVISLKDVFKVRNDGVTIDGIDYTFKNGDFELTYRLNFEDYIISKADSENIEILKPFSLTNDDKYAYGAYYANHRSVLCKVKDQTVVEYPDKLFTGNSNMSITGRIYNMRSYPVICGGEIKEVLVILADKVTNGGVAPMIVLLDISSETPAAIMSEPIMIDMTHYNKNATTIKDGNTVIYGLSEFDDTIWTYVQTTDKGLKIDGKLFRIKDGNLVADIIPD